MIPENLSALDHGFHGVPEGHLAAVVTVLEKDLKTATTPAPRDDVHMIEIKNPEATWYRNIYKRIGGPWLWEARLRLDDAALLKIIRAPSTKIFVFEAPSGEEVGFLELDFFLPGQCEIAYIGLLPESTGRSIGSFMMAHAYHIARNQGATRMHVHTCTLDDARALEFYNKCGFLPVRRAIEIFKDPRHSGLLSADISNQPLL